MIRKTRQPETWSAPDWHPDLGDAKAELEHLRAFAMALLDAVPDATVELELPEPGLMNLAAQLPGGPEAEIFSVSANHSAGQRRYGLFLKPGTSDEQEIYEDNVEDAVACLINHNGRDR